VGLGRGEGLTSYVGRGRRHNGNPSEAEKASTSRPPRSHIKSPFGKRILALMDRLIHVFDCFVAMAVEARLGL